VTIAAGEEIEELEELRTFRQRTDGGLLVATSPMRKDLKVEAMGDTSLIRNTEPQINQMPFPLEKKEMKNAKQKEMKNLKC
jgi:hypothetical protein